MANDLKKENDQNPIQDDYDARFDSGGGGGTSSSGHASNEGANLSNREAKPDGSHDNVELNPREQAQIDQMEAGLRNNNLYDPEGTQQHHRQSFQGRIKGVFAGRRKYGWIGGGVVGTIIGIFLTLFPVLGPVHIFSNLTDHNFGFNDHYRRNRTGRIIRSVLNNNNSTDRNLRDTPFKLKADLVDFEKFETRMNSRGWAFDYNADGKAIGLIDPAGNRVNLDRTDGVSRSEFNRRIKPVIDDTIPAYRMNKRVRTRALVSTFTGPTRSFKWTSLFSREARQQEPNFNKRKFLKESGLDSIRTTSGDRIQERRQVGTNDDGSPIYEEGRSSTGDVAEDSRNAVLEELDRGGTKAQAVEAGQNTARSRLGVNNATALSTLALVVGCISYQVYEHNVTGQFERYTSAMRIGSTFLLATNEMQQGGDIDVGEVGQLFGEYNNEQGTFASSAAWQRASGADTINGQELDPELHVIEQPGSKGTTLRTIESAGFVFAQFPGFGSFCNFLQSGVGIFLTYLVDVVEIWAGCMVSACLAAAGRVAAVEVVFQAMGRLIAASLTNFVGFLVTHPVQAGAFLDQSLSLISSEENRTAEPVTSEQYNAQVASFKQESSENLPIHERYLALENSNSLTASLAKAKMNLGSLNPARVLASLFSLPSDSLVAAVTAQNVYAQTDIDFDNYGFQKYSFNNEYIDVDPFDNAEDVVGLIDTDNSIYLDSDNGNYARDFAVMCMGYVPEQGIVDKSPLNASFLPRFSDPETSDAPNRNRAFEKVCLEEANKDPELYAKIGRFVDDIELISSIIELTGESVPTTTGTGGAGGAPAGGTPPPDTTPTPTPPEVCDPDTVPGGICVD